MLGLHIAKVDDYISKPFSPQELMTSVENILSRKKADFEPDRTQINGRTFASKSKERPIFIRRCHPIFLYKIKTKKRSPARIVFLQFLPLPLTRLMFRRVLSPDEGLLLVIGHGSHAFDSSIHMLFVPFDLAVFWINAEMIVVDKVIAKSWAAHFPARVAAIRLKSIHTATTIMRSAIVLNSKNA